MSRWAVVAVIVLVVMLLAALMPATQVRGDAVYLTCVDGRLRATDRASAVFGSRDGRTLTEIVVPAPTRGVVVCINLSVPQDRSPGVWLVADPTAPVDLLHPHVLLPPEWNPSDVWRKPGTITLPVARVLSWPRLRVSAAAYSGGETHIATNWGTLRVCDSRVEWVAPYHTFPDSDDPLYRSNLTALSSYSTSPNPLYMVADHEGNLWCRSQTTVENPGACYVMPTGTWPPPRDLGTVARKTQRWLLRWRAPAAALAGDAVGVGLWTYGLGPDGRPGIFHVVASTLEAFKPEATESALPPGLRAPALDRPLLAASLDRKVWLAGDSLAGAKVFMFDGKAITDITPPPELLQGRRFTQLLTDKASRLYVSTDGAGVLVYDGKTWTPHAINAAIPEVMGTGLKQVSCMTIDDRSNLWVGCDNNVICWREGK